MAQSKGKTQKIMNLECGSIWLEVILKVTKEKNPILVVYKKHFITHTETDNHMDAYSYRIISRKKIHECQYLVEALDWISTYIKTGQYLKEG